MKKFRKIIKTLEKAITGRKRKTQIEFEVTMGSEIILHQNISREFHEPFSTGEFDASISKLLDETRNVSKAAQSRSPVHTKEIEVEAIHFLKEKNKAGCLYGKVIANLQGIDNAQLKQTVPSRINRGGQPTYFVKLNSDVTISLCSP